MKLWFDGTELGLKAPKGALTPELVGEIKAKKSELLGTPRETRAAESRRHPGDRARSIGPRREDGTLPLSFSQRRLWFLDQLEPDTTAYNMPLAWTLRGPLDVAALGKALTEVVRRHEILRTRFVRAPRNAGTGDRSSPADRADRRGSFGRFGRCAPCGRPERALGTRAANPSISKPAVSCVQRSSGWRRTSTSSSSWSTTSSSTAGRPTCSCVRWRSSTRPGPSTGQLDLDELPVQYADFATWQEDLPRDSGARPRSSRPGALRSRASSTSSTCRPIDRGRRSRPTMARTWCARSRPTRRTVLSALARSEGATTYMALLAVYHALLLRWTGQEDSIVGTIVANRNRAATEGLIGFFANTLVLRTDLSGDPSFRTLLTVHHLPGQRLGHLGIAFG